MQHPSKLLDTEFNELGGKRTTYSEFDPASLEKLLVEVMLDSGDVFVDLGFGLGKVLFQAAMSMPVVARGIELSHTRHARAQEAWALRGGPQAIGVPLPVAGGRASGHLLGH